MHLSENISDSFGGIKDRKYCLERLFSFHKFFYLFFRFLQCFVFLSEMVDGAPKVVKEGASKAEAEDIKTKLEAEGAKVNLK